MRHAAHDLAVALRLVLEPKLRLFFNNSEEVKRHCECLIDELVSDGLRLYRIARLEYKRR